MKVYEDIESIERDIKILDLERKIAWEEIKSLKDDYKDDLRPLNWVPGGLKIAGSLLGMWLLKKIF